MFSMFSLLVTLKLVVRKDMLGLTECLVVWQCFNIGPVVQSDTKLWFAPWG